MDSAAAHHAGDCAPLHQPAARFAEEVSADGGGVNVQTVVELHTSLVGTDSALSERMPRHLLLKVLEACTAKLAAEPTVLEVRLVHFTAFAMQACVSEVGIASSRVGRL